MDETISSYPNYNITQLFSVAFFSKQKVSKFYLAINISNIINIAIPL